MSQLDCNYCDHTGACRACEGQGTPSTKFAPDVRAAGALRDGACLVCGGSGRCQVCRRRQRAQRVQKPSPPHPTVGA